MRMGKIYIMTNKRNGKQYVGQTLQTLKERFRCHMKAKRTHPITLAIKKYGLDGFHIQSFTCREDMIDDAEKEIIAGLNTLCPNGYNVKIGGANGPMTEEHKRKISEANKGRKCTPEQVEKMRAAKLGKKQSPEHIEKRTAKLRGRIVSAEARRKIGAANTGKKHPKSKEAIEHWKVTAMETLKSEEYRRRQSETIRKWWAERKAQGV